MRFWLFAMGCLLVCGCTARKSSPDPDAGPNPALRVAIVTDLKGYLEPCGCTSRPLGGIDRMAAEVRSLRESPAPVLLVMGGDLFFDAAAVEPARLDQANRNAETLVQILNGLEVSAALPGARDRAQQAETLATLRAKASFPWLAMSGDAEVVRVQAGGVRVAIVGVRPGADPDAVLAAVGTAQAETDVTIAVVSGSRRDANRLAAVSGVDFVVQGGLDEDEPVPPHQAGEGWVLHAGRQGQGLTVVDVYPKSAGPFSDASAWSRGVREKSLEAQIADLSAKIDDWKKEGVDPSDLRVQTDRLAGFEREREALQGPPPPIEGNAFTAQWVELDPDKASDPKVSGLMKAHDKVVNEANRVAFADLKPPPLRPGDIPYVGSKACSTCHVSAFAWWQTHPHGRAYETLETRNKEFNLDCVGCHVTGYNEPGGSTVTWNLDGALENVGCESCHGPGGEHVTNPSKKLVLNPPETACVGCHNEEHSDQFDYQKYRDSVIVPGHGAPLR
ncbi:MAG: multiheme c-type cytochrome [Myxococcota bacterium]